MISNDHCAAAAAAAATTEGNCSSDYPPVAAARTEMKYSGLEAAAAARKQRETSPTARDSVKSRYSSDPCKVLGSVELNPGSVGSIMIPEESGQDDNAPVAPAPPTPLNGPAAAAQPHFSKAQRLPVDEDDYLTPKSSNPAAYMDLVDGM